MTLEEQHGSPEANPQRNPLGENDTAIGRLEMQLRRVEQQLAELLARTSEQPPQEFYSTADLARLLGKAEWTVREWCRNRRVVAEKRRSGRGRYKEWMVSHEEVSRIRSEGLLPVSDRVMSRGR